MMLFADGRAKPGAVFYHDSHREDFLPVHRDDAERRRQDPNYLPSEYHRLLYDIFRYPEIPPPVWLVPDQ